jgi:hypothetical protein
MMYLGVPPLGALLGGCLAQRFGAPITGVAGGVACVLASAAFARQLPAAEAPASVRLSWKSQTRLKLME